MDTWTAQSRSMSDGALVVKDEAFNEICVIREKAERSYGEQDKQDQANAAKIAAAPYLLANAIFARGHLYAAQVQLIDSDDKIIANHIRIAYEALSAAIKKATA